MHDWTLDEAESEKVIKHTLDLGYNFFDTANGYLFYVGVNGSLSYNKKKGVSLNYGNNFGEGA